MMGLPGMDHVRALGAQLLGRGHWKRMPMRYEFDRCERYCKSRGISPASIVLVKPVYRWVNP